MIPIRLIALVLIVGFGAALAVDVHARTLDTLGRTFWWMFP